MPRIQAFNESTIARHLSKEDFFKDELLSEDGYRHEIIRNAICEAENLFPTGIRYNSFFVGKKKSYSISNLSQRLVFRTCATFLTAGYRKESKSRSQIARELKSFLADGTPYNIYRLDIASFFENIKKDQLSERLGAFQGLSMQLKKIIKAKMEIFNAIEGVCVPRGLETSSILADIYLQEFDKKVLARSDVFFFTRFVDDILIISSADLEPSNFRSELYRYLPDGLYFNDEKTEQHQVDQRKKAGSLEQGNVVASFNYLGFSFNVIDSPLPAKNGGVENSNLSKSIFRQIDIDLSSKKTKRLKTKICKAFYSYGKNNDYLLLKDRIRFLTTNRELLKKDDSTVIPVGIYYNSSACDLPSEQLQNLDQFMRYLLFSSKGRLVKLYTANLSLVQKKELAKFSFRYGFENRVHKRFSYNRLTQIVGVWQ